MNAYMLSAHTSGGPLVFIANGVFNGTNNHATQAECSSVQPPSPCLLARMPDV